MKLMKAKTPLDTYVVASRNGVRLNNPKQGTDEVNAKMRALRDILRSRK